MADLPISFSGPMVRATLREIERPGTGKTQTRRVIEPTTDKEIRSGDILVSWPADAFVRKGERFRPRYRVGDRLYVREHWRTAGWLDAVAPRNLTRNVPLGYEADQVDVDNLPLADGRFRQAMHMPKWASRITLIVTDVRVERLQDCSEADAIAEGIERKPYGHWKCYGDTPAPWNGAAPSVLAHGIGRVSADPLHSYATLWDSINGHGAWAANPWVVAYTFKPILGHIDQIGELAA